MNLYTKDQLLRLYAAWKMTDLTLPTKNNAIIIIWPKPAAPNKARIAKTELKSTYDKPLYSVTFTTI